MVLKGMQFAMKQGVVTTMGYAPMKMFIEHIDALESNFADEDYLHVF